MKINVVLPIFTHDRGPYPSWIPAARHGRWQPSASILERSNRSSRSSLNTPPVFAIYVVLLVTRWLLNEVGGLEKMDRINRQKAATLYTAVDQSDGFYQGRVQVVDRSLMNVTFNLPNADLEKRFIVEALTAGLSGLNGHRAIGGIRATIYNALSQHAVESLVDCMAQFQLKHG